jgi:hypothetical protein
VIRERDYSGPHSVGKMERICTAFVLQVAAVTGCSDTAGYNPGVW